MPPRIDISGTRVGRVRIIERDHSKPLQLYWKAICDCGRYFSCFSSSLKRGEKFECKDCMNERKRGIDLTGRKFGRWTVLKRIVNEKNKTMWHCKCDCGNEGYVATYSLGRRGRSLSCGCLGRKEKSKHANTTLYPPAHGLSKTNFYSARTSIIHKCYSEHWISYEKFGGIGVTVCELWRNSAKDMHKWALDNGWEKGSVICLKSGCKEFNPENCFIITENEFRSHIALTFGMQISYNGETHSVLKWAKLLNVDPQSLRRKLVKNPSIEQVFTSEFKKCNFVRNPELKKEIIKLYESGKLLKEIAKITGKSIPAITYHLKNQGVIFRESEAKKLKKPYISNEVISELFKEGKSINDISKTVKLGWPSVLKRLKKMGLIKTD